MNKATAIQTLTAHLGGTARDKDGRAVNPDLSRVAIIEAISVALEALTISDRKDQIAEVAKIAAAPVTVPAEPVKKIAPPPAVKK